MVTKLRLAGSRVSDTGDNIVLIGNDDEGRSAEIEFLPEAAEELLAALATASGHAHRLRTKDTSQKKILPMEWWEIHPHPRGGLILCFRLQGGMELNFHLQAGAVAPFEQVFRALSGSLSTEVPEGRRN